MTFNSYEQSIDAGQPVALYRFSRGVLRWLYCSADRDITVGSEVYRSLSGGVTDAGAKFTGDATADKFVVTAPADIEVAQPWRTGCPSDQIELAVFDMHYGDNDPRLRWAGRIQSVNWPALDRCRITCVSRDAEMGQPGLDDAYSQFCTATLGDERCGVDLTAHRVSMTIQSMDGAAVQCAAAAGYPDGWFMAGWVEWPIGSGEYDRRHIDRHVGTELRLLGGTAGIPASATLRVLPGCDFLFGTCTDKYANSDRFRGIPDLERRSPFDGNAVW